MKIALLSDIHGNSIALEAVLADVQAQGGVDGYWVLGDLVALGHDPIGVLERLSALPNISFTRGNTDYYICSGERPGPTLEEVKADPDLLPRFIELIGNFAWTQGMITAVGWFDWLAALPLELRLTLPDGTRFLGVHAAPGTEDGPGIRPNMETAELKKLLSGCEADLICVGHTHWPLELQVGDKQVVNLGSVSLPWPPDLRASYYLLEATEQGCQISHRRVDYDREAVVTAVQHLHHPGTKFITQFIRGERQPPWLTKG